MNTFGSILRITTFGESHGAAVGVVIDGCPAGVPFDAELMAEALRRRRPGSDVTSSRKEPDVPEVISGVFDEVTTGAPIAVLVHNRDQRSKDYNELKTLYRPSHADFTYDAKYGRRDHRGGGRSSARETLARVIGGAVARMVLREVSPIEVRAAVSSMRDIESHRPVAEMTEAGIYRSDVRCHDPVAEAAFRELLATLKDEGDSTGGTVSVSALDVPAGLGDPVYRKLHATLSFAMMSINGATGFEMGAGFAAAGRKGSENNDQWDTVNGKLVTKTNHSGGVQGGISNGNRVEFRVSFKPPSSIATKQSLGTTEGDIKEHAIVGRHDPSIVVRAVPVVEGMTWLVLADAWLRNRVSRID